MNETNTEENLLEKESTYEAEDDEQIGKYKIFESGEKVVQKTKEILVNLNLAVEKKTEIGSLSY